jgi:hypothetical protein
MLDSPDLEAYRRSGCSVPGADKTVFERDLEQRGNTNIVLRCNPATGDPLTGVQ